MVVRCACSLSAYCIDGCIIMWYVILCCHAGFLQSWNYQRAYGFIYAQINRTSRVRTNNWSLIRNLVIVAPNATVHQSGWSLYLLYLWYTLEKVCRVEFLQLTNSTINLSVFSHFYWLGLLTVWRLNTLYIATHPHTALVSHWCRLVCTLQDYVVVMSV